MIVHRGVPGKSVGQALLLDVPSNVLEELVDVRDLAEEVVVTPFGTWRGSDRWPVCAEVLEFYSKWIAGGSGEDRAEVQE
eukprot:6469087-Amphidinium_carterae.9